MPKKKTNWTPFKHKEKPLKEQLWYRRLLKSRDFMEPALQGAAYHFHSEARIKERLATLEEGWKREQEEGESYWNLSDVERGWWLEGERAGLEIDGGYHAVGKTILRSVRKKQPTGGGGGKVET